MKSSLHHLHHSQLYHRLQVNAGVLTVSSSCPSPAVIMYHKSNPLFLVTGQWSIEQSAPGHTWTGTCHFVMSSGIITGVINVSEGYSKFTIAVREGKFVGDNQIEWVQDTLSSGTASVRVTMSRDGQLMVGTTTRISGESVQTSNVVYKRTS